MSDAGSTDVEVLIVGGGPVGLAAAIELGHRGITCLLVERNDRVGYSPRAKTTNVRSREHMRRWGIADQLRRASPMPSDYPTDVVFATRMNGHLLGRFPLALNGSTRRNNLYSEEMQWVPQYVVEDVLRKHASSLDGVELRFGTEYISFSQDESHVKTTLRDVQSGQTSCVRSAFLIGADGARSSIRSDIGATMIGEDAFSRNFTIIFRAPDLASRHSFGKAVMYWMINEDLPSVVGPMENNGLWYLIATRLPDDTEPSRADAAGLVRQATGLEDLALEIVATDLWLARRLVADKQFDRRVFLAGDACHLHPPFGGFGMNMGIGDAVDIGWKIAATLQGWGGKNLLATYEFERKRVHERTVAEAARNYAMVGNQLVRSHLEDTGLLGEATREEVSDIIAVTKIREFRTLGLVLGYHYAGSPIVIPDGSEPPPDDAMVYIPSAHPGCLAPHLWLSDGSSLYDHFGQGFTLLVTRGDAADAAPLMVAAEELGIPVKLICPNDARLFGRYQAGLILIRPDQHVAWRGNTFPSDVRQLLAQVTGAH
ncbi:MAG: FAD-dependent monooxygenase [Pseudorhodoplanes sp.]|nr:FAD-dependent monooxygenase [Pseudorhodoplanes sp.]